MSRREVDDFAIQKSIELENLLRQIYATKSERFISIDQINQLTLQLGEIGEAAAPPEIESITYERKKPARKKEHPGRHPLPADLPRKEILIEPKEDISKLKKIGEEITETLDYTPAKFFVNRYIRPKYARPQGEGILTAPMPSRPIEKGMAEAGLLAIILIEKYLDHLPLYRQIQRFKRAGIKIADSTIGDWVARVCKLIDSLYQAHRKDVLTQSYLMADETTIKVLDRKVKGKAHLGYHWAYFSPIKKLVLFDYQPSRKKEEPLKCLANFQGYLQTDGYPGYDQFEGKKGIVMLNCMAHARRKFFEAGEKLPEVIYALEVFHKLYAIERQAREEEFTHPKRQVLREEKAKPIWEEFKHWMIENYPKQTPKTKLRKAIGYTLRRWQKLGVYILKGELEIDNNLIENQIRPIALGRKNYLFAGSHQGAKRAAMIYSLLATCKMKDINPYIWLKDVLEKIPEHPVNKVAELLPQNWKPKINSE